MAYPFSHQVPFTVKFEDVRIRFVNGEVPPSQCLYALNGSLVGLVSDSNEYESSVSKEFEKYGSSVRGLSSNSNNLIF
jgi:hypothetical protein